MALVLPGPEVTKPYTGKIGVLAIGLRRDGKRLFMQKTGVFQRLAAAQRIIQVHRSAAGQHKDMTHASGDQKLHHIIRKFNHSRMPAPPRRS